MDVDDPRSKPASPKCKEPSAVQELPGMQKGDPESSNEAQSDDVPADVPTA